MYYRVNQGRVQSFLEKPGGHQATVGCITLTEFEKLDYPAPCYAACRDKSNRYHSSFEVYDSFSYGILHLLNIQSPGATQSRVAVVLEKNLFLLVLLEDAGQHEKNFLHTVETHSSSFTVERILSGFLGQAIAGSGDVLADCQKTIMTLEAKVSDGGEDLNRKIFCLKNELILRKSYYEELVDLCETVQDDENALFEDMENFRHLRVLCDKLLRLSGNVQLLCESLVHVREAYQSSLDYRLNSIMKLFTVVTTIFLPLSLIAGWYGMNFTDMPELSWQYGYPTVIVASLVVAGACIWYFKKKKLL